jgi:hypothetical protein
MKTSWCGFLGGLSGRGFVRFNLFHVTSDWAGDLVKDSFILEEKVLRSKMPLWQHVIVYIPDHTT